MLVRLKEGGRVQLENHPWSVLKWSAGTLLAVVLSGAISANIAFAAQSGPTSSAPVLQYTVADSLLQVNLTSTPTLDWIHWGRISQTEPDRKNGNNPLISDYAPFPGAQPSTSSTISPNSGNINFSWSDGQQAPALSGVNSDLETFTPGTGYQVTVPADTSVKTLNLYVEVFGGQGQLQASLSDGSAPALSDQSIVDSDMASKVYSIDFRAASPGQTLTVTFTALSGGIEVDLSIVKPDWIPLIQRQTFDALQVAFLPYAVHGGIGGPVSGKDSNRLWVVGQDPLLLNDGISCGLTAHEGDHDSRVFYMVNMAQAQQALKSGSLTDDKGNFVNKALLRAIARGIGNIGAHEIGHQLNLKGMHDGSVGTYNSGNCDGSRDPSSYTGFSTGGIPIHWGDSSKDSLKHILGPRP